MFIVMFAAILGGAATAVTIASFESLLLGFLLAPLGGSFLALLAAVSNVWRAPKYRESGDTELIVADLGAVAVLSGLLDASRPASRKPDAA